MPGEKSISAESAAYVRGEARSLDFVEGSMLLKGKPRGHIALNCSFLMCIDIRRRQGAYCLCRPCSACPRTEYLPAVVSPHTYLLIKFGTPFEIMTSARTSFLLLSRPAESEQPTIT